MNQEWWRHVDLSYQLSRKTYKISAKKFLRSCRILYCSNLFPRIELLKQPCLRWCPKRQRGRYLFILHLVTKTNYFQLFGICELGGHDPKLMKNKKLPGSCKTDQNRWKWCRKYQKLHKIRKNVSVKTQRDGYSSHHYKNTSRCDLTRTSLLKKYRRFKILIEKWR